MKEKKYKLKDDRASWPAWKVRMFPDDKPTKKKQETPTEDIPQWKARMFPQED